MTPSHVSVVHISLSLYNPQLLSLSRSSIAITDASPQLDWNTTPNPFSIVAPTIAVGHEVIQILLILTTFTNLIFDTASHMVNSPLTLLIYSYS